MSETGECPICGQLRRLHWEDVAGKRKTCRCPPNEKETEFGLERKCGDCGEWWLIEQFQPFADCVRGRSRTCLACTRERKNTRRRAARAAGLVDGNGRRVVQ